MWSVTWVREEVQQRQSVAGLAVRPEPAGAGPKPLGGALTPVRTLGAPQPPHWASRRRGLCPSVQAGPFVGAGAGVL